jgi:hypothetical protein
MWKDYLRRSNDHDVKGFLIEVITGTVLFQKVALGGGLRIFKTHIYISIVWVHMPMLEGVEVHWCVSHIELELESRI